MADSTSAGNGPKVAAGTAGPNGAGAGATDAAASSTAGIPFYEQQRKQLKELILRRRALEKKLAAVEDHIAVKEADYLESTPGGNIVIGFDNYVKGGNAAAAQRRKTGLTEQNKVFSRSSVSYNPAAAAAAAADAQTPGSTPAPTPMSSSFGNGNGPSGAPTPTSATGGGGGRSTAPKKSKKNTHAAAVAAAAGAGAEDSETDGREAKKVRTSFGARK
ncbi:hypothetical protein VTI28DRAFT_9157 [Corynascus sepedonium]